ncbi:unnamed protein product, partial [Symbiodinium necroappetens]
MGALRALLAEQSLGLLQAQQSQMTASLQAVEERQSTRLDKLEQAVQAQGDKHSGLEDQVKALAERLARVEARPQVAADPAHGGPNRRLTLVFGGWERDTRKGLLLEQLKQALAALGPSQQLDAEAFCTGARRSVALCPFKQRPGEDHSGPRDRMLHIVQVVNSSKVTLEGAARPLWATFSKTPAERGRASWATIVRKVVLRCSPARLGDVEVEYLSGRSWIRDDQLSGMGDPPAELKNARVITTRAGPGWLDERTLARWVDVSEGLATADLSGSGRGKSCMVAESAVKKLSILGWNVGGADLHVLPKAVRDSLFRLLGKDELVLLQEVPREAEGWNHKQVAGRRVVTHQSSSQWRGTGLWYDAGAWCLLRKVSTNKGTWFKLRHLEERMELWVGTAHFSPGASVANYELEVHDHFAGLPRDASRVVFKGDVNTGFSWAAEGDEVSAVAREGKGNILHKVLMEAGLAVGVPERDQMHTPTSRPRQEGKR